MEKGIGILDQLCESDFGKFLLKNKGLNGFWTQYVILHPYKGRITNRNQVGKPISEMEKFLLNKSPQFLATQERFVIFQKFLRDYIKSNMTVASIPCGLLDDLLTLRVENLRHVEVVGIDLDLSSLEHAVWNYQTLSSEPTYNNFTIKTEQKDAFNLESENRFDLITSNGLNIYVYDDDSVIDLYKEFYKALKPDGYLLTSHVVYPPHEFDDEDFEYANTIFHEIIDCQWKSRSVEACVSQFFAAGFDVQQIEFDSRQLYPTFLCKKRGIENV